MTRMAVLLGVVALLLAACGDSAGTTTSTAVPASSSTTSTSTIPVPTTAVPPTTTTTTTTTAPEPSGPGYGGEAVVIADFEPGTLNPYAPAADDPGLELIGQLYLVGISEIDASLAVVPEVLEVLPSAGNGGVTVNDDGTMTVRYRIRDEARWADGVPISGGDLLFTLETLAGAQEALLPYPLTGTDLYGSVVPGSAVAGAKTFELTLAEPTLLHQQLFSAILPEHEVAGTDLLTDWDDRTWVEGGPFRLEEWVPRESMSFVRNDNYWKTDAATGLALPYLDRVVFRFVPDNSGHVRMFADRGADVFQPIAASFMLDDLRELEPDGARIELRDGVIWEHFNFQLGENNPNAGSLNRHADFRRAVAHAIDRDALLHLDVYGGPREPLRSYLDVIDPAAGGDGWDRYPYQPERARELIAGLCAELGRDCAADPPKIVFSTTSNADERPMIARALAEMLPEAGIEVELDLQDSSMFFGPVLDSGAWDMAMWAWVATPGSFGLAAANEIFDPDEPPPEGFNYYRWGTPAVAAAEQPEFVQGPSLVIDEHTARYADIVDEMRSTVDEAELRALAREAEDILAEQVVIIPLVARGSALAWWGDELGGIEHNPSQAGFTWNLEQWYRVDR